MLSGKDICSIIRAGNKAKVASIELDSLKIVFQGSDQAESKPTFITYQAPDHQSTGETGQSTPKFQPPDLDELILIDPAAYEQAILQDSAE